jgi:hypothetical protein
MKLGNVQDLLDKKFTKEELAEIDREVEREFATLKASQQNLFDGLKSGLEEAIAHEMGMIHLPTESIEISESKKIRKSYLRS